MNTDKTRSDTATKPALQGLTPLFRARICAAIAFVLGLLNLSAAAAQVGDGPRAYQLLPENTRVFSQYYIGTRGNFTASAGSVIRNADIDVNIGLTQFTQTFDIAGRQAGVLAILPYGNLSGSLGIGGTTLSGSDAGLGDIVLGFVYGAYGAPSLSREAYFAYDPGLSVNTLVRLTLPTGAYDSGQSLNLGANRWALELGLPVTYFAGSSFLDGSLMAFEIQPKITLFGDNTDAPGTGGTLEQDPLFTLEAHVSRNFGQAIWGSLDALYTYGGETRTNGVSAGNTQRSLALGVSGNLTLSEAASIKATYGEVVSGNAAGSDGRMFRLQFLYSF